MEGGTDITSVTFRAEAAADNIKRWRVGGKWPPDGREKQDQQMGEEEVEGTPLRGKRRRPRGGKSFSGFEKSLLKGSTGGVSDEEGESRRGHSDALTLSFFSREA